MSELTKDALTLELQKMQLQEQLRRMQGSSGPAQSSAMDRFATGVGDPLYGTAQLASQVTPDWLENIAKTVTGGIYNALGLETKPVSREELGEKIRQREIDYQASRGKDTGTFDPYRLGGNIATAVPMALAVPGATAPSLLARAGASAVGGGLTAATQPVTTEGSYWPEKGAQVATGTAMGGLGTGGFGLAGKAIRGSRAGQAAQALYREGIRPTIGQTLGGVARSTEEKLKSAPVLGSAIARAERKSLDQFNRSVVNRALRPLGMTLDKKTPVGNEAVAEAYTKISGVYDDILPRMDSKADMPFLQGINNLRNLARNMEPGRAKQFERIMETDVVRHFSPNGTLTGRSAKEVISNLKRQARDYGRSADPDHRRLGAAIEEAQRLITDMMVRQNQQLGPRLKAADKAYAHLLRTERAAAFIGAAEGIFTPPQYLRAIQAMDSSLRKRSFAHGKALDQRFAQQAKEVLASKYPDSGTTGRAAMLSWPAAVAGAAYSGEPALAGLLATAPPLAAGLYAGGNRAITPLVLGQGGRYLAPGIAGISGLIGPPSLPERN